MKSSWTKAVLKRIDAEVNKCDLPKFDFISRSNGFIKVYAERENNKMQVKTYANRTQANKKAEWLRANGYYCGISMKHPFIICLINIDEELRDEEPYKTAIETGNFNF